MKRRRERTEEGQTEEGKKRKGGERRLIAAETRAEKRGKKAAEVRKMRETYNGEGE